MEKLIISKELANEVERFRASVSSGVETMTPVYFKELDDLAKQHNFLTAFQVSAYLIGGQERVYEVKKHLWRVVWLTGLKKFYAFEGSVCFESNEYEVLICVCDTEKEADKCAERLNRTLDAF